MAQPALNTDSDLPDWTPPAQASQTSAPPVAQDSTTPDGRPRIVIRPAGSSYAPSTATPAGLSGDSTDADLPDWKPTATPGPSRTVGVGEAALTGAKQGASLGFSPAIEGLAAAGDQAKTNDPTTAAIAQEATPAGRMGPIGVASPVVGAAKMLSDWVSGTNDPDVQNAYERGRQKALQDAELAKEQHKGAYIGGLLAGSALLPVGGPAMTAATLPERVAAGAATGGVVGGIAGAGEGVSNEQSIPDIATSAVKGAVGGAATGGVISGALGPGLAAAAGPGERAAQTAEAIGAPLPKGVASDSRAIRSATAATASIPFAGARVRNALDATREAAGDVVNQSGIDQAIAGNRQRINSLYDGVRSQINPDQVMPMPRTAAAVAQVRANRVAARQANPNQGLEQFDNIATQGVSFNGAHRARVDAREAGDALNPHPGYNSADYNQITRAMTGDIRANVHTIGGMRALRSFEQAETNFGPISGANKFLSRIARQRGPGAGLDELGYNPATGEFSLDKFVTALNKLNPESRPFVPAPGQARNIQAIFEMGSHIKSSMRERNTSHTSTPLIMWDLARDAVMTGAAVATGIVSGVSVLGSAAAAAPAVLFMHWLASPARAASMSAWARAYRGFSGSPTPARAAMFKMATRNLANNLDIPVEKIMQTVQGALPAPAAEPNQKH